MLITVALLDLHVHVASSLVLPRESFLSAMEALVEVLFDYRSTCINGTRKNHSRSQRHDFTALLKLWIAVYTCTCTHSKIVLKSTSEKLKEKRKKEASKVKPTFKAKQHSTPKTVTFPKKNDLPRVVRSGGTRTHDTLYSIDRALYH